MWYRGGFSIRICIFFLSRDTFLLPGWKLKKIFKSLFVKENNKSFIVFHIYLTASTTASPEIQKKNKRRNPPGWAFKTVLWNRGSGGIFAIG